jgi:hypothetical protein
MKYISKAKAKKKDAPYQALNKLIKYNTIKQSLACFITNSQHIIDLSSILYQVCNDTVTLYCLGKSKKVVIHPDANIGSVALRFQLSLVIMGGIPLTDGDIEPCDIITINLVTFGSSNNFSNMNHARICFAALNIRNKYIFTAGGKTDQSQCSTTEILDADKNAWNDMPLLKKGRQSSGAIYCLNKIYVIGGISGKELTPSYSFEECSLLGSAWKLQEICINSVMNVLPVCGCNEYSIFVGCSASNKEASLYIFNSKTRSIELIKEFSIKSRIASCANTNNSLVCISNSDAISVALTTHSLKISPIAKYFSTFEARE